MFVLLFKNSDDDPTRNYFDKYYMPLVKIKDFYGLIDNRLFFWSLCKKRTRDVLAEMSKNKDYATGNLLDYSYCQNWNIANDQSVGNYNVGNEIIYSTEVLKSNICD